MEEKLPEDSMKKISSILKRRPPQGQFRDQLFWLVDIIYACKASGNVMLVEEAKLMEKVLGSLSEFLKNGNQQALNDATTRITQFARIVKAAVAGDSLGFNIFLSYSTIDTDLFKIPELAKRLEEYPEINKVFYWEKDSGQDIMEYMEDNIEKSRVFIHFCTQNSIKSKSVKLERRAALQLKQEERLRIIPIFQDPSDIPLLLKPILGVEFNKEDFDGFIEKLYKETLRR